MEVWIAAGYPPLLAAIAALWRLCRKKDREIASLNLKLLEEKERHIQELEDFKKLVLERRRR